MPKLIVFAACHKVIRDADSNEASLIGLLSNVTVARETRKIPIGEFPEVEVSVDGEYPTEIPLHWSVYTCWQRTADDASREFKQYLELHTPDGRGVSKIGQFDFTMNRSSYHRVVAVTSFPTGQSGSYTLRVLLEDKNATDAPSLIAEYPISITHTVYDQDTSFRPLSAQD